MTTTTAYQVTGTLLLNGALKTERFAYDATLYGALRSDSAELLTLFHAPVAAATSQYQHVAIRDTDSDELVSEFGKMLRGQVTPQRSSLTELCRAYAAGTYPTKNAVIVTESRRDTVGLTEKELKHFFRVVRVRNCKDAEMQQQCVVDAILYFSQPGKQVLSLLEGGKQMSYYLGVKASNIFIDFTRSNLHTRGRANEVSLEAMAAGLDGNQDVIGCLSDPSGTPSLDMDAQRLRGIIFGALSDRQDKLRLLELHLEGFSLMQISTAMGWTEQGDTNTTRVRKALFDTLLLLKTRLPALESMRTMPGISWGPGKSENRATRMLSSAECELAALRLEGPVSLRDRKRLKVAEPA